MVRSFFKPAAPPVARGLQTASFRRRRHAIAEGCDLVSRMWAQGSMQTMAMETLVAAASLRDTPTTRVQRSQRALQRGIATVPLGPSLRSGPDRGLLNPPLDGPCGDRRGWLAVPSRSIALWYLCRPKM